MAKQVGLIEEVDFHIYKGKSLAFDVLWWLDDLKTIAAVITSTLGKIKEYDGKAAPVIVNLAPTFVGNRVVVRLTPAQTLAIVQSKGFLEIEAATTTVTKTLARGRVIIHQEISE